MKEYTYLIRYRKQGETEISNIRYSVKEGSLSTADSRVEYFKNELCIYNANNNMNYSNSNGEYFYKQLLEVKEI